MKSEKFTPDHVDCGIILPYHQIQVAQFQLFNTAMTACEAANNEDECRHYILNESGEEYYMGSWID